MPEHIHFVIFITEKTDLHLGKIIGAFKKACTEEIDALHVMAPGGVFEEGYNDRILRGKNQLQRMLDYVSNNPRKRMERISFRGFHCRHFIANSSGERFEAYGNIQLLEDFDCCSVKISSKYSSEKLIALKKQWLFTILNGGVIVSPFISEAEKRVRDWAIGNGGRLIIILENGFGERYSPKGLLHELVSEGRLLLIAPLEHRHSWKELTRAACLEMNQLAEDISSGLFRRE